ncbi:MAG TPA: patatin-like phospholipase family protein [Bryobacteraceae bacterium]|jgi:NTE family protein
MRALVLSGGGLFGAWQAGAWIAKRDRFQPDLIVGCSVGSLNGYAIACGATPEILREMWLQSHLADFSHLDVYLRELTARYQPRTDLAVVVTRVPRLKPRIFRGPEITWRHLAASCAVPLVMKPVRLNGAFYADGGLLNPLPVYAAVELGATEILALHCLPEFPSPWLRPFARGFAAVAGVHPAVPRNISVRTILPSRRLGSLGDALHWKRENIEAWLELGQTDAQKTFPL